MRRSFTLVTLLTVAGCRGASALPSRLSAGPVQYLSQSGLYTDIAAHAVDPANRPYAPRFALWSDGGAKQRWLQLPAGGVIDTSEQDAWTFPVGTVVWKEFAYGGKRVETRMLEKVEEGMGLSHWSVSVFQWNAEETEATRVNHGMADVAATAYGTRHDIPSVDACAECHESGNDVLLGVSAVQLAGPGAGLRLADLVTEGALSQPPPSEPTVPGTAEEQALFGGLHANCSHCHNPNNAGRSAQTGLHLQIPAAPTDVASMPLVRTAVGQLTRGYEVPGKHLGVDSYDIVPGHPEASAMSLRAHDRSAPTVQMPPLATEVEDTDLSARLDAWIAALPSS